MLVAEGEPENHAAVQYRRRDLSHIIVFDYTVAGKTYTGSRYVGWNQQCPVEGQNLTVYYDRVHPDRCAVKL